MFRQNLRRSVVLAALAGISASAWALGAGPDHPPASDAPAMAPVRQVLLAQCIAGSDEIAMRATRESRQDRTGRALHAVCYAAILPAPTIEPPRAR